MITGDFIAMGQYSTGYLLDRGFRRVGFVSEVTPPGLCHDSWLMGYQLAHIRRGISIDPALVQVAGTVYAGGTPAAKHYTAMDTLPDAYVVPDTRIASSFYEAMKRRGIEIDSQRMVISGHVENLDRYGLLEFPYITEADGLIPVVISRLKELSRSGPTTTSITVIPFQKVNFIDIGQAS